MISNDIQFLKRNQESWENTPLIRRIEILAMLLRSIRTNAKKLSDSLSKEISKPISQAKDEISFSMLNAQWYLDNSERILSDKILFENSSEKHIETFFPKGILCIVLPWNFPISLLVDRLYPALLSGNSCIIKFSEYNEKLSVIFSEIINSISELRNHVVVYFGDGDVVNEILDSHIDILSFTGSRRIGHLVKQKADVTNTEVLLELGGSNVALVLSDADIDVTVKKIIFSRFFNNGQYCDAIKKVLVHQDVFQKLYNQLKDKLILKKIGVASDPSTEISPLATKHVFNITQSQISESVNQRSNVWSVDSLEYMENLILPTIITNVTEKMSVWNEEVFAPVLPIMTFKNISEAISLVNKSNFDIGASVFTKDLVFAEDIARKITVGTVEINSTNHWNPATPFGGLKKSGNCKTCGEQFFRKLTYQRVICIPK